jgi:hypothetical protein
VPDAILKPFSYFAPRLILMNQRLYQLDRLDAWLLSLTKWQLRQLALMLGMTINLPNAWLLSRCPYTPDQSGLPVIAGMVCHVNVQRG